MERNGIELIESVRIWINGMVSAAFCDCRLCWLAYFMIALIQNRKIASTTIKRVGAGQGGEKGIFFFWAFDQF